MSADPDDYDLILSNQKFKPWYECTEAELADCTAIWHMLSDDAPSVDCALHEFLGMTQEQYNVWVVNPEAAKQAARGARNNGS
jgi:hypothetical protein